MTPSLIGSNTNHERMGDDTGDRQCSSKRIQDSNMMTCDQNSSDHKTDSGYITIQYDTKKGLRGKSELIEIIKKNKLKKILPSDIFTSFVFNYCFYR